VPPTNDPGRLHRDGALFGNGSVVMMAWAVSLPSALSAAPRHECPRRPLSRWLTPMTLVEATSTWSGLHPRPACVGSHALGVGHPELRAGIRTPAVHDDGSSDAVLRAR
jgi:hypothetical protein